MANHRNDENGDAAKKKHSLLMDEIKRENTQK